MTIKLGKYLLIIEAYKWLDKHPALSIKILIDWK